MQGTPPSTLPRQVGGFRLVRELGRGGMGVVYEAHELDSGRVVALKVLAAELAVSGEAFERFQREARIAASISDLHCVFVYGAHQIEDSPAIAMELVGGETLQDRIHRGDVVPIETAVRWIIDVIDGLEAAHQAGVIHRDVKPSNCFVTLDGQVKIGDFGLSRTLERDMQLTQSGQFLGSPLYASPEQIRGRTVDARSDQYSCAATLYAVLTGRGPFGGNNVGEVLARILSEPPARMRSLRPEVPSELERVVLRAMEREPDKRFRDLDAFRTALLPFSNRTAAAASIPRRLAAWLLDAAIVGFGSSTIATWIQTSGAHAAPDPDRPWLTIPLGLQLTLGLMPIAYFAVSEALFAATIGKWLVGVRIASVGKGPALWVRAIARAFLYECVALILMVPLHVLPRTELAYMLASPAVFLGTFAFRLSTMRKRNGWRGPYELWTGTRVIQAQLPFRKVRGLASPPERHVPANPDMPEKLGEYRVLGLVGTTSSGALVHARDERLERSVWIQFRTSGPAAGEARRSLNRSNRLRWLESLRAPDPSADVFESPGGCALADMAQRVEPLDWPMTERILSALAEELARSDGDAVQPNVWSTDQVWIDRNWNVRLLDEPIPIGERALDSVGLLGAVARALLAVGPRHELPPDLPVHAEPLVRALIGTDPPFADLDGARAALTASQSAPAVVERRTRSAQLAVGTLLLGLLATFAFFVTIVVIDYFPKALEMRGLLREMNSGRVATSRAELHGQSNPDLGQVRTDAETTADITPSGPELDERARLWRATVLAYESTHGFGGSAAARLEGDDRAQITAARKLVPAPTSEEVELARANIREQRGVGDFDDEKPFTPLSEIQMGAVIVAATTAIWTGMALLSALIWPGGLSFRLFGLSIRRGNGRRGGRLYGFGRVALMAIPLSVAYGVAVFCIARPGLQVVGWLTFALVAALHAAGLVLSILDPSRGPIERLLNSRIVPR